MLAAKIQSRTALTADLAKRILPIQMLQTVFFRSRYKNRIIILKQLLPSFLNSQIEDNLFQ